MQKNQENTMAQTSLDDLSFMPPQKWFTLKDACSLKNLNYKTACNRPYLQPNFGKPAGKVGGRKVFSREMVVAWLSLTDDQIQAKRPQSRD